MRCQMQVPDPVRVLVQCPKDATHRVVERRPDDTQVFLANVCHACGRDIQRRGMDGANNPVEVCFGAMT